MDVVKRSAPTNVGYSLKSNFKIVAHTDNSLRVSGRLLLNAYNLQNVPSFQLLDVLPLNPSAFGGTRLAITALMYEKFVFNSASYTWIPDTPTSQQGSIVVSWDSDPSDTPPPATALGLVQYLAHSRSVQFPPWEMAKISISSSKGFIGYTDPGTSNMDDRLFAQGQAYVVCAAGVQSAAGRLYLDYDITFFDPQVSSVSSGINMLSFRIGPFGATQVNPWNAVTILSGNAGLIPQLVPALSRHMFAVPPYTNWEYNASYFNLVAPQGSGASSAISVGVASYLYDSRAYNGVGLGGALIFAPGTDNGRILYTPNQSGNTMALGYRVIVSNPTGIFMWFYPTFPIYPTGTPYAYVAGTWRQLMPGAPLL